MLNFISKIFGGDSYLGVDIGTGAIKIVEISRSGKKPLLLNYGIVENTAQLEQFNNASSVESIKLVDKDTAKVLKKLVSDSKFKSKNVIASIPAFFSFNKIIEIPQLPDNEISKLISLQIKQYLPLSTSEVNIEWFKIGEKKIADFIKYQILIISVSKEQVLKYKNIFRLAGLNLIALEIESLSLLRSLSIDSVVPTVIADIGSKSTNIIVSYNGLMWHNSQTELAGRSLTQAIASGLGVNIDRAEELKRRNGLLGKGGEYELSTLTHPFLDAIINEVNRAREVYERTFDGQRIRQVVLVGGGANLLGIEDYFKERLGLTVSLGNSFDKIEYQKEIDPKVGELKTILSVAIGLGIR